MMRQQHLRQGAAFSRGLLMERSRETVAASALVAGRWEWVSVGE